MSAARYLAEDVVGGLAALALFPAVLAAPGYVLGHALDVLGFRRRGVEGRLGLSVGLSVAAAPVLAYLTARFLPEPAAPLLFVGLSAAALALVVRRRRAGPPSDPGAGRRVARGMALGLGGAVLLLLLLADLPLDGGVYPSILALDYAKHISVTGAIGRTGVPPVNPSFYPGHPLELYYYYFWFLLCSIVERLGGAAVPARAAVLAGTAWSAGVLLAGVALCLRFLGPARAGAATVRRTWFVAAGLLLVTGLDIVPVLVEALLFDLGLPGGRLHPTVEWWNEQVTAWFNMVLWVPHHLAAFAATLTALVLLRAAADGGAAARRAALVLVPLALASALGMSIWVAFSFALVWLAWASVSWAAGRRAESALALITGLAAVVVAAPFLLDLIDAGAAQAAGSPVRVQVRGFLVVERWVSALGYGPRARMAADLAFLPVGYLVEFGFFAVGAALFWRRRRREGRLAPGEAALVVMAVAGLLVASFLRSTLRYNDLGWRSVMYAQLPLLLWSAAALADAAPVPSASGAATGPAVAPAPRAWRWALAGTLVLGAAALPWDLLMMKLYPLSAALQGRSDPGRTHARARGREAEALRAAYAWIDRTLPSDVVVQHNPVVVGEIFPAEIHHGLYGNRQVVAADEEYGTLYGVPAGSYDSVAAVVAPVFTDSAGAVPPDDACRRYGIGALLVKASDPAWRAREGWVWRRTPIYDRRGVRVYACADGATATAAR